MARYAQEERETFADTLAAVGPDAPTMCGDWTTRDLAAHIVLRDRHPVAAAGILVKPLSGVTERVQRGIAGRDYAELVATVRRMPSWSPMSVPTLDEATNTLEFYIHTEDVRRAQPDWRPRQLADGLAEALWRRARGAARLALRRFPATVSVVAPGFGQVEAGAGGPDVVISGDPGELVLFLSGRQRVAHAEVTGPEALVGKLRTARLGV